MANLALNKVCKSYDKKLMVVKDFNMQIEDKEFIVLVGPSGCGKSTMLRMIAGLEKITSGEIYIDDILVNDKEPMDRGIAMVFQNYALYPHMTVYDNLAFALKMKRTNKKDIKVMVEKAAEILQLTEFLNRKPKTLSGGQRQRVAIGRTIVRNPKVFLMDEPLSNLDAKLRNHMRAELKSIHKKLQATFIYVTHDQTEAMTLGTRIVVMSDGVIQQIGTPREVFNHPINLFVAGFIGFPKMNLFKSSRLIKRSDGYILNVCGKEQKVGANIQAQLMKKGITDCEVTVGIRPEDFDIVAEGIAASVDISEDMGSEVYLHMTVETGQRVIVKVKTDDYSESTDLIINIKPDKIHLFGTDGINLV